VSVDALLRANEIAVESSDREHVTTLIRRDDVRFRAIEPRAPFALRKPELRLTVDTGDDLEYMRRVMALAGSPLGHPSLETIIAAAESLKPMAADR
jgi:spore coat polysaccharide biosynthesis protein SpsF (cytidylyltransferase family)